MTSSIRSLPPISVFISYAKEDDAAFLFADPLKSTLKQLISGLSGRTAEVFLDRDDIPLGENWKERLENGIRRSLVLVAVYTGNYPRREACREEFFLFLEQSKELDVQSLLIPVVWLGFDSLLPEGEDEISDYVRTHQAADFKEAWVEGTSSAPFRANILKIAERILQVNAQVEETLAAKELDTVEPTGANRPDSETADVINDLLNRAPDRDNSTIGGANDNSIDNEEDDDGLLEINEKITTNLEVMTHEANALGEAMSEFSNLPVPPSGESPAVATKYMIRAANAIKQPSMDIDKHGSNLFEATRRCDASLRRLVRVADSSGSDEIKENLRRSLGPNMASLSDLSVVDSQLTNLLEKMRIPEALSASFRKAVRPARRGVTSVRDALALISDWPSLVESLQVEPQP